MSRWMFVKRSLWYPDNLADLRAWYKADAITGLSDGDPVSTWSDSSGGGYDLTQTSTARPLYQTATLNGLPVVEFDGSDDYLAASTAADWAFLNSNTASEVLAVWKAGSVSNANAAYALLSTNRGSVSYPGVLSFFDGRSSATRSNGFATNVRPSGGGSSIAAYTGDDEHDSDVATIIHVKYDFGTGTAGNRILHRINGGSAIGGNTDSAAVDTGTPDHPLYLGRGGTFSWLHGYIAEVVICDAALSSTDREKVEGYLAWKWGLESNLPSGHPYENAAPTA